MNKTIYILLYIFLWLITLLPLRILFLWSDIMYITILYVFPYRKKVVYKNLRNAFPEKSPEELKKIIRSFYRFFTDFMIESIKSINFLLRTQERRFVFKNIEIINDQFEIGNNIVLVSGHYGNWEWMNIFPLFIKHKFMYAARVLRNSNSDILINKLRQKYGAVFVNMKETYRRIMQELKDNNKIIIWLLGDQRPPKNAEFWTPFLNQETAFFLGAGKMVKKFGFSLIFMDIQRTGRGRYEINFELLTEGKTDLDEYQITKLHVKKLEEVIKKKPDYWLWSHKRWKHKKPQSN